jgi:hypothetical protein
VNIEVRQSMAIRPHPFDSGLSRSRSEPGPRSDHPASTFRTVVVRYADAPDRCTIYPRVCDDEERQVTWISVDLDIVATSNTSGSGPGRVSRVRVS